MTMSAAFASMLFRKNLYFVGGEREGGVVLRGTEKIISQNLYPIYDDLMISKIKELFNSNRFDAGKELLKDVTKANKETYIKLFDAYYNSLIVLKEHKLHSIAFPLISSGVYGGSLEKPAKVSAEACIKAYNKFLMYLDHPIQGYVDLFGEKIAYTSFQERCMIEKCRSMITVRSNAIIHSFENTLYEDYSYERFATDVHNVIMDDDERMRYGFPISDELRLKILKK